MVRAKVGGDKYVLRSNFTERKRKKNKSYRQGRKEKLKRGGGRDLKGWANIWEILNKMFQKGGGKDRRPPPPVRLCLLTLIDADNTFVIHSIPAVYCRKSSDRCM